MEMTNWNGQGNRDFFIKDIQKNLQIHGVFSKDEYKIPEDEGWEILISNCGEGEALIAGSAR
jgi:hypothetical protein